MSRIICSFQKSGRRYHDSVSCAFHVTYIFNSGDEFVVLGNECIEILRKFKKKNQTPTRKVYGFNTILSEYEDSVKVNVKI